MIRIKTHKKLNDSFKWLSFDSIAKSCIQNPTKSLWWSFFAKLVNNFQLLTFFCKKAPSKILYNFINCPVFKDIKYTLHYKVAIEYYVYFLCIVALCLFSISSLGKVLQWLFQTGFFHLGDKKMVADHIRQVVDLYIQ